VFFQVPGNLSKARPVISDLYRNINIHLMPTLGFCIVFQTFGFDDDEDYEVDDGGDDGMHYDKFTSNTLDFIKLDVSYPPFTVVNFVRAWTSPAMILLLTPSIMFVKQKDRCISQNAHCNTTQRSILYPIAATVSSSMVNLSAFQSESLYDNLFKVVPASTCTQ
jgi:hypothetical protein